MIFNESRRWLTITGFFFYRQSKSKETVDREDRLTYSPRRVIIDISRVGESLKVNCCVATAVKGLSWGYTISFFEEMLPTHKNSSGVALCCASYFGTLRSAEAEGKLWLLHSIVSGNRSIVVPAYCCRSTSINFQVSGVGAFSRLPATTQVLDVIRRVMILSCLTSWMLWWRYMRWWQ